GVPAEGRPRSGAPRARPARGVARRAAGGRGAAPHARAGACVTTFTRNLVLIVDDNEAARYVNARVLEDAGFDILETASGERAVGLAQRDRPELVLLDIKLPDIDGFEVCRRLRADPRTASMAIVQISATFESAEYQVRGLEGGADTFLVSPIEPTVLVANVRAMLRLRRAVGELR